IGHHFLRALGARATDALAPSTGLVGALVAIPPSARAEDLGLDPVAPGIGRLHGSPARIESFGAAHPDLRLEGSTPVHPLMHRANQWVLATTARSMGFDGSGVMVGVADTGIDVTHPEMRDEAGNSRVAWLLDLSKAPTGIHRALEEKFGIKDDSGKIVKGAVFSKEDIDSSLNDFKAGRCDPKSGRGKCAPSDEIGHGTHVTGIAAASGAGGSNYGGIAPKADIIFVRITRDIASDGIDNDHLVRAVQFMFDRSDADKRPIVVNLSLGSDFGPHDGTLLWEQAIGAQIGPTHPGRVVIAAAGNSGSIAETPIHQSVRVTDGTRMRVP